MTRAPFTLIVAILAGLSCCSGPALAANASPRHADRDRDGLSNRYELRRSQTNPRRVDTDRDGLSDGREVKRLRTDPLKADSDGDGVGDGREAALGSDPRDPESPGSAPGATPSDPLPPGGSLRPPPPPPPSGAGCAATATSAPQLRTAVAANPGTTVCVQGNLGPVDLNGVRPASTVSIRPSPGGGSLGWVTLVGAQRITIEGLRLAGAELRDHSRDLTFRDCVAGGTASSRFTSLAVFDIRQHSYDVTISGCDIGWTGQTQPADSGYGIRAVNGDAGPIDNLVIEKTRLHHLNCDALQVAGAKLTFDRNEVAHIASLPGYDCHADSVQVLSLTSASSFTNNWFHHLGYHDETHQPAAGYSSGQFLVHGWSDAAVLMENNLFTASRNHQPHFKQESSGAVADNWTFRRNTFASSFASEGQGESLMLRGAHTFTENIVRRMGGSASLTASGNVYEEGSGPGGTSFDVSFDAHGNPTNLPTSHAGAGYRKPSGVRW